MPKDWKEKNYKGKPKQEEFPSNTPQGDAGTPEKEKVSEQSSMLQQIAFRDLSAGFISVAADPNSQATRAAKPYAIIARTNRVEDASYPGKKALDGNTLQQLLNSSKTKLMNCFDVGSLDIEMKYLYMAIESTDKNQALNLQIQSAMEEALSFGYSEMLTQLPFYTNKVESDMPGSEGSKLPLLTWYQTMLMNTGLIAAKYLQTRALQQTLEDMGYNQESPLTHDLFGKLKKSAFRAVINSVGSYTKGEYFDKDWFEQMNVLVNVPSRKTDSMNDPLLTIRPIYKVPNVVVKSAESDSVIFDSSTYVKEVNGVTYTAEQLAKAIIDALDAYNILRWARQKKNKLTTVTATDYFNNLVDLCEAYKDLMVEFASDMSDVRTFLDRMNLAHLNNWVKGVNFKIPEHVAPYTVTYNVLLANVFAAYGASANSMIYDEDTLRWKFFTMWNKYTGIAKYDSYDGGSFLTFSVRDLPASDDYTETRWLIPKLFDVRENSMRFITRLGFETPITYQVYTNSTVNSDYILSRLNPLSVPQLSVRMPRGSVLSATSVPNVASALYQVMNTVFGHGQVEVQEGVWDTCLSADNICYLDVEMDDISNAMITFARVYAPFKVLNETSDTTMGFLNIRSKKLV